MDGSLPASPTMLFPSESTLTCTLTYPLRTRFGAGLVTRRDRGTAMYGSSGTSRYVFGPTSGRSARGPAVVCAMPGTGRSSSATVGGAIEARARSSSAARNGHRSIGRLMRGASLVGCVPGFSFSYARVGGEVAARGGTPIVMSGGWQWSAAATSGSVRYRGSGSSQGQDVCPEWLSCPHRHRHRHRSRAGRPLDDDDEGNDDRVTPPKAWPRGWAGGRKTPPQATSRGWAGGRKTTRHQDVTPSHAPSRTSPAGWKPALQQWTSVGVAPAYCAVSRLVSPHDQPASRLY